MQQQLITALLNNPSQRSLESAQEAASSLLSVGAPWLTETAS